MYRIKYFENGNWVTTGIIDAHKDALALVKRLEGKSPIIFTEFEYAICKTCDSRRGDRCHIAKRKIYKYDSCNHWKEKVI